MNLVYRGNAYQSAEPMAQTPATQQTGHFLGQCFLITQCDRSEGALPAIALTYRGVHYRH